MQRIKITYMSTNINPAVSLILFFRLNGIYVSEEFLDYGFEEEYPLMTKFPEIRDAYQESTITDLEKCDMQIFIVDGMRVFQTISRKFRKFDFDAGNYVIINTTKEISLKRYINNLFGDLCINYINEKQLLDDIIDITDCDSEEQFLLHKMAAIYCDQKVWQINLWGKYFYSADMHFGRVISSYKKVVSLLERELRTDRFELSGGNGRYMQYAICNLRYEANLYCQKSHQPEVYDSQETVMILVKLLGKQKVDIGFRDNVQLLLTQIYDELLKEPNIAYENYLALCRDPYSAFVYMKKAEYWKHFGDNIRYAIKYYAMSVAHFLEYYQAWYNLGICYVQVGSYRRALDAFQNVKRILRNRRRAAVLRPMEMEYLYKSYCCSGYIQYNYFRDIDRAIKEDVEAEYVWDEIEYSRFYEMMGEDDGYIREVIKKQFNIKALYRVIYKLANKSGDLYLANEYYKRLYGASDEAILRNNNL